MRSLFDHDKLSSRHFLYAGAVMIIVLLSIAALLALAQLRQLALERAAITTQSLARSVDKSFEGLIDTINVALQASADEISRQMASGAVDAPSITYYLKRQQARLADVAFLRATNERGDVIYGPGVLTPPNNNADRDYFLSLRADPQAGLFVVKPLLGRIDQKWVWAFARRISKNDGSFGGVVFAAFNIDNIEKLLAQIQMEHGGSIALRGTDLGLIARHTFGSANPIAVGDQRLALPFKQALKANRQEGTYTSDASSIDAVRRIYSYRQNAKYSFVVNVGMGTEAALADWRKQAWMVAALVLAFALAVLVYARLIGRAWRRQEQDMEALAAKRQALQENEERYHSVTETATDAIVITDSNMHIVSWNPAAERIFGYTPAQAIGQPLTVLMPERYREQHLSGVQRVRSGGAPHVLGKVVELSGLRQDGSEFPLELEVSSWQTSAGQIFAGTLRDITERKQAEEEIHAQLGELLRWQEVMLDREERVQQLKAEVNELLARQGEPTRYSSEAPS
ncbi:MAG: hypothetical protein CVU24_08810 [Betaproteobacteria bacterium HGW-Betaproteobacteria-18]|nr:MAG: hypothetical protein CVU24_08810 [Betaproteobacteria bacterium HGW-Betaproteobacteria-18]